jgi:FAD/FMN-containing dehydrogenase
MPEVTMGELAGWGRHPVVQGRQIASENLEEITEGAVLSRGLGRSYGDASLPASPEHAVVVTTRADRLLSFDPATGTVRAQAGLSLAQLNRVFLPRGWFPPASPGTQYVTLGGMVAADVHGKSHHREGSFGEHVCGLRMRVADGRILEVSDRAEAELFHATLGGMGLTGHVLEVEFRMQPAPSPWILAESERLENIDSLIEALHGASGRWPYTLAWVDLLGRGKARGRGILQRGRWADPSEAPRHPPRRRGAFSVPVVFPDWFLSAATVLPLNVARYVAHGRRVRRGIVHPQSFFYPLDALGEWNRLYGHRGFTQYQAVVPLEGGRASYDRVFEVIERTGAKPFLCVLKNFRAQGKGTLSFPREGLSMVFDIPIRGTHTQRVVDALNDVVAAEGGRVYLAKDALTRAEHFRAMEPRLGEWSAVRRRWDPAGTLRSALSVRLMGDRP